MSSTINSLLTELNDAIVDGDTDRTDSVLSDLQDAYDSADRADAALYERSLTGRDRVVTNSETRTTLDDYLRQSTAVDHLRSGILAQVTMYLASPENVDSTEIIDMISKAKNEEQALADAKSAAQPIADDIELPPMLRVQTERTNVRLLKGESTTIKMEIANYGDGSLDELTVEIGGDASATPSEFDIGTVGGGKQLTEALTIKGDSDGEFKLTVTGDAPSVDASSESVEVTVLNKESATTEAASVLEDVRTTVESGTVPGNSLTGRLETAARGLKDAKDEAKAGRARQANNALNRASNALEAVLNQFNQSKGRGQKRGNRPDLPKPVRLGIEATTEQIDDAETAAI